MNKKDKEKLKLEIAEFIGGIKSKTVTINGERDRVIVSASVLVDFMTRIIKAL